MVMGLVSGWSLANHSNSESFLVTCIAQPRWMLTRGILESGWTRGVSFQPFPNPSSWWWLISSVFLIRISCHRTTHANSYYGAWSGWAVSIRVLPLRVHDYLFKINLFLLKYSWCTILYKLVHASEKAMAPHSSTLAWKIPWTEEPGRLQSMGSRRVGHDWATSLSLFTFMPWRRKWQPTPVFLPGESQGWGSLVGCHLWGRTESNTTEAT